jgi:hypothetical protein
MEPDPNVIKLYKPLKKLLRKNALAYFILSLRDTKFSRLSKKLLRTNAPAYFVIDK